MAEQDWLNKDYYAVLGVSKDASDSDITKAYRKLARQYHPDLNKAPGAEDKFKEISEAYDVLSDKDQRQKYDAIRSLGAGGARFAGGSRGNYDAGQFSDLFGAMFGNGGTHRYSTHAGGPDFSDLFGGMFSGTGSGFHSARPENGRDRNATVTLTFRQAVEGATVALRVGGSSFKTRVPAGVQNGQRIRIPGKGEPGTGGGAPGDLYVDVKVQPDPKGMYSLEGDYLVQKLPITLAEATFGATVPTRDFLTGDRFKVRIPEGAGNGAKLRVRSHGVGDSRNRGDLLVVLDVQLPDKLTDRQKKALKEFDKASADFNAGIASSRE